MDAEPASKTPSSPSQGAPPTPVDRLPGCPLCASTGGVEVWSDAAWRAVRVADDDFPVFYRLIATAHVAEFSDLPPAARHRCIDLVAALERTLIDHLRPTKVNLATLGNVVPHLHWHVIARFNWDSRFPEPIWAASQRPVDPPALSRLPVPLVELDARVATALAATV